jgi:alpha-glucosidase
VAASWWRHGVLYEIYPRSFADTNGDGVGDLPGIVERLEYLAWLGVDAVWLNPTFPSPNADWGYDVSDYRGVHPELGTLGDLDRLVGEARRRGIRVLLDLVPAHSSDRHPWFGEARAAGSDRREWYVWGRGSEDGRPPNGYQSIFGGPAWEPDATSGEHYLHSFLAEQPDLNWRNEGVRREFDEILRFWLDRGIAGFRIDVAHRIVKAADVAEPGAVIRTPQARGGRKLPPLPPVDLAATHAVLRGWRTLVDGYPDSRALIGETYVLDVLEMATYYGTGADELHLAFNFPFVFAALRADELGAVIEATEEALPTSAWPVWTGSNHDVGRLSTRWCDGDERRVRCALLLLLTLRGTPVLYAGDEIGLTDVEVPRERLLDPVGVRGWPDEPGRDRCRTPMRWTADAGAGFTAPGAEPWLPLGSDDLPDVADQRDDPRSTLWFTRELISLRRSWRALHAGDYERVDAPAGVLAWRRGRDALVALNFSDEAQGLDGVAGTVVLSTTREREGDAVRRLELAPWTGAVVRAAPG